MSIEDRNSGGIPKMNHSNKRRKQSAEKDDFDSEAQKKININWSQAFIDGLSGLPVDKDMMDSLIEEYKKRAESGAEKITDIEEDVLQQAVNKQTEGGARDRVDNKKEKGGKMGDRIRAVKESWKLERKKILKKIIKKDLPALKESENFYIQKIESVKAGGVEHLGKKFIDLLSDLQESNQENKAESMKDEYIDFLEIILDSIREDIDIKKNDVDSEDKASSTEKAEYNEEDPRIIEMRIKASKKRWEREKAVKINNIKIKDLEGLEDSRIFYSKKISGLEEGGEGSISGRLSRLIETIQGAKKNNTIKEGEALIADLKESYIKNSKDILTFIDEQIESKNEEKTEVYEKARQENQKKQEEERKKEEEKEKDKRAREKAELKRKNEEFQKKTKSEQEKECKRGDRVHVKGFSGEWEIEDILGDKVYVGRFKDESSNDYEQIEVDIYDLEEIGDTEEVEKNAEEGKDSKYEENPKKIKQEVSDRFADELNIEKEDLENIEGFDKLSEGQQMLALENLHQLLLARVEEEGEVKHKEKQKNYSWKGKLWEAMTKKYQIAKHEKTTAKEFKKGGIDLHEDTLKNLTNGMLEYGPQADYEDGKIKLLFSKELNISDSGNKTQKLMGNFDNSAQAFSQIPDEWKYDTASGLQRAKYKKKKEIYEKDRKKLLEQCAKENGDKEAMLDMTGVDMKIHMNQFLNHRPEAMEELNNITDEKVLLKSISKMMGEKGVYMSMGVASKSVAVGLLGAVGAPLAAAGMGGSLAWYRAKNEIKKMSKLGRKGDTNLSSETNDYVDASYYNDAIETLLEEIDKKDKVDESKMEMLRSLRWNTEEARKKMQDGSMNYGQSKEEKTIELEKGKKEKKDFFRVDNQYKLTKNISQATTILAYYDLSDKDDHFKNLRSDEDALKYFKENGKDKILSLSGGKLDSKQNKEYEVKEKDYYDKVFKDYKEDKKVISEYLSKQFLIGHDKRSFYEAKAVLKGAMMAGTFASLGVAIREYAGDYLATKGSEVVKSTKGFLSDTSSKLKDVFDGYIDIEKASNKIKEAPGLFQETISKQFDSERTGTVVLPPLEDEKSAVEMTSAPKNSSKDVLEPAPLDFSSGEPRPELVSGNQDNREADKAIQEVVEEDEVSHVLAGALNDNLSDSDNVSPEQPVGSGMMPENLKMNSAGVPDVVASTDANVSYDAPDEAGLVQKVEVQAKFAEQIKLATIQRGAGSNSIEGVFIKQLINDPKNFGFEGDTDDSVELKRWAGGQAHRIATANGYFDQKTGQGIWMKASSIGHNAYVLNNVDGKIGVDEYVNGGVRESHVPAPKAEFESDLENNEYVHSPSTDHNVDAINTKVEEVTVSSPNVEALSNHEIESVSEVKVDERVSVQQQEVLDYYNSHGISQDDLSKVGINIDDDFTEAESLKSTYLINRHGNIKEGIEVINMADKIGASYQDIGEYHKQLKELKGNSEMSKGLIEFLKPGGEKRLGLSKIFEFKIEEGDLIKRNGEYMIKGIREGIDVVVKNDGGDVKFGATGRRADIGMDGWLFGGKSPSISLTNDNINETLTEIEIKNKK